MNVQELRSIGAMRRILKAHGADTQVVQVSHAAYATKNGKVVAPHLQGTHRRVVFASGVNRAPLARGVINGGVAPGVAVDDLPEPAIRELIALKGTGMPVFVDSGAYGEFVQKLKGKDKPITDEQWGVRLAVYERLARSLGDQLHVVAPDRIGNQMATLARLKRHAAAVQRIRRTGASVLMPMQGGAMPVHQFYEACASVLGFRPTMAFPMKQAATPPEKVLEAVAKVRPKAVHLLGLGPKNKATEALVAAIHAIDPKILVTQDANYVRSQIGDGDKDAWGQQTGKGQRAISREWDEIAHYEAWHDEDYEDGEGSRYTDEIGDPSGWIETPEERERIGREVAKYSHLSDEDEQSAFLQAFIADPTDAMSEYDTWNDWTSQLLDDEWAKHTASRLNLQRRAEGVTRVLQEQPFATFKDAAGMARTNRQAGIADAEPKPDDTLPLFA